MSSIGERLFTNHTRLMEEEIEGEFLSATRDWVSRVPIGLHLCPWAGRSSRNGGLRVRICPSDDPAGVAGCVSGEILLLTTEDERADLDTALVVCSSVGSFNDFDAFDCFVRTGIRRHISETLLEKVTLVAFHPKFTRWHGLPDGVGVGSEVDSHYGNFGRKSQAVARATIVETSNPAFGLRKIKVRFHQPITNSTDGRPKENDKPRTTRQEQYVPIDWLILPQKGEPLPDNYMYRSPFPTVHIIVNSDLAKLSMRDVSKVKRLNSKRLAEFGWEGLKAHG